MPNASEITALFQLIDDPDEEVFNTISDRLLDYGSPIIPDLENLWENTLDENTLERIERMIYKLRLHDLKMKHDNRDMRDFYPTLLFYLQKS